MDKKKTGNVIREARIKKNYTQSELGDLLGVSNKAVSRWENGDSFPDVGVLENLAAVLSVKIQDIVTGEQGAGEENAVVDIVRVATIQQKEKRRKLMRNSLLIVAILLAMISGISTLKNKTDFFVDISIYAYIVMMVLSSAFILVVSLTQDLSVKQDKNKLYKISKIVAVCSVLWIVIITWSILVMIVNDIVPFGMELALIGPFINNQLVGIFVCNIIMLSVLVFRFWKYDESIHWGWLVSVSAIYLAILYSDLLHRMNSLQGVIESLSIRTIIILLITGIFMVVTKLVQKNKSSCSRY